MKTLLTVLMLGTLLSPATLLAESPRWPGGTVEGEEPVWLAPGLVSTGVSTRDCAMSPDMDELWFCMATPRYTYAVICVTRRVDGAWTEPAVAEFSGDPRWMDIEPAMSSDGAHLYFMSTRPDVGDDEPGDADIWVVDRQVDGWSEPRNLGAPVNTEFRETFPSLTAGGTLYFGRADSTNRVDTIWRARPADEGFAEPERLPAQVNAGRTRFNAWVAPDESRLILATVGLPGGHGGADYFQVDRGSDDTWSEPANLGGLLNAGKGRGWSPYVTPDGKSFVFMTARRTTSVPWPATWSALQGARSGPGAGQPGIAVVGAAVLESRSPAVDQPQIPAIPAAYDAPAGAWAGTPEPGDEPEIFAPGFVSTGMLERDLVVHPGGRELWWGFMEGGEVSVLSSRLEDGRWTEPVTVPFHTDREFACFEPCLSADGQRVLFLSNQAAPGQEQGRGWANQNIFECRRTADGWSEPAALPAPITTAGFEYFPSLATDGTLYFSREGEDGVVIWFAEPVGDGYAEPVRMPETVNVTANVYNATVAPDESWLVSCVAGHDGNLGAADYWISFRGEDGAWLPAVNMGPRFNGEDLRASSVALSPDGEFFFFSSSRRTGGEPFPSGRVTRQRLLEMHDSPGEGSSDLWWVRARVLEELRPE
ncbi:MAG: hypothetical protein GY838_08070 [bacterium]|nr:hypothetical protein [bacterium]